MKAMSEKYLEKYRFVHFVICECCGEEIKWLDSDYIGGSTEDDKFGGVLDKLKWHRENDNSCIREKKLNALGI